MSSLTGKQAAFVNEYLGAARFNATVAAKLAGYKATSKHSFESIGSENLTKRTVREAIDQHFKLSRMTADEVLIELTALARGSSRDKIKALALLSQHHNLLDGKASHDEQIQIKVKYETDKLINQTIEDIQKDLDQMNTKKDAEWKAVVEKYREHPIAIEALELLERVMKGVETIPIPEDRELIKHYDYDKRVRQREAATEPQKIAHNAVFQAAPVECMRAGVIRQPAIEPELVEPERARRK